MLDRESTANSEVGVALQPITALASSRGRCLRTTTLAGWFAAGTVLAGGGLLPWQASAASFACTYTGAGGAWTTAADWAACNGSYPNNGGGNTYDASINNGAGVSLTTANTAGTLSIGSGSLGIASGALETFTGNVTNGGTLNLDQFGNQGGSSLTVGGTLTNSNFLSIANNNGNLTAATTIIATGLSNTGTITLNGSTANQASLIVGAAAPAVSTGIVNLSTNALLQYSGGGITSIGAGAQINEDGVHARIAIAGAPTTNSALTGLSSNAGQLLLQNGSTITTTTGLNNTGNLHLDQFGNTGGSSLTIGGTLTNSGLVAIANNNGNLTAATTITTAGLSNTGTITLDGSTANQASLIVGAAAPTVATGIVNLSTNALLQYSGGGITSIGAGAQINETGAGARIAIASAPGINSALTSLSGNDGQLLLQNGSTITTTTGLNNTGNLHLDQFGNTGGSSLTIGGTLTNSGLVAIANNNGNLTANSTITTAGLSNTGTITLDGSTANQASLIVGAAAPAVSTGTLNLSTNALLQYTGGGITSIGAGAQINESGVNARIAIASAPTTNSALTGLSGNAGQLLLQNGSTITTTTGLNNTGTVNLDQFGNTGGSSLTIGGTLTNSSTVGIGTNNGNLTANSTITANDLNNTGTINLNGSSGNQASLIVGAAAPAVSTGTLNLSGTALLQYTGGGITSIGSGAQINESGVNARIAIASAPTTNSALTGLSSNAGQLLLQNGSTITTTTGLNNTGTVNLDQFGNTGGSSLTIGGTLTNSSTVGIGTNNGNLTANSTITANDLNNTGTINLNGSTANKASLIVGAAAPAVSTGTLNLSGTALLQYTGGGITSIGSGAQINESGVNARIAIASAPTTNSALTGLSSNAGQLLLQNGSTITTTTGLNNTGTVNLDQFGNTGGSSLTIGGTLTNSATVGIGTNNGNLTANSTITANGLNNTGTINLNGSTANQASLIVGAAAPSVSTGTLNLSTNALLQYTGGGITSIGAGAQINEFGPNARIAIASAPSTNSALTGLSANAGQLLLQNGSTITTTTGLNNTGSVNLDQFGNQGGSSLTVGGTLNNSGVVAIANNNGNLTANSTITTAGLNNTGTVNLNGTGAFIGTLAVNGAAVNSGTANIGASSALTVSGAAYTQSAGTTNVAGTLTAPTVSVTGGTLQGTGTVQGAVLNTGGTVAGGFATQNQVGTLNVAGSYTQGPGGTLLALLQGTAPGQSGTLAVAGPVTLTGGTLQANTSNGFALAAGQTFTAATFTPGSLNGLFGSIAQGGTTGGSGTSLNLGNGLTLGAVYNDHAGNIQMQVVATPASTAVSWNGGTGTFGTPGGWSTNAVPTFFNDVTIGATGAGNVTLNQDATVNSLAITGGNTLQYQAATPQTLTVGQNVSVQAAGSVGTLILGTAGDKLALGGNFSNAGNTTIGNGAIINAQGTASNTNQILIQGGTLSAASVANSGQIIGSGTVTSTGGSQLANNGVVSGVQAQGGILTIGTGIAGTAGRANVQANSTLDLSGATTGNTTGTLQLSGVNARVNLGGQNITVSNDYSNTNFGVGNAFNKTAGVVGAGQVLAAGNTAQAITGAAVANGTTAAPTIDLGQFHANDAAHTNGGASTTFNVVNPGTTGPSLRGAIQTTGITDARLSGSGVTQGNFGPVATGGQTGAYTVSVSGAGAGALTGQSIHVANNFANVGEQTVAITGTGYNYAAATTLAPVNFGNVHVNAIDSTALAIGNVAPVSAFTERLDGSASGATGSATATGAFTALNAGATSNAVTVGLDTRTAGAKSGTATVAFTSNAAGVNSLGNTALAPQTVAVTGNVYNLASSNTIAPVNFGVLHVGTGTHSMALGVTNTAPTGAFSEGLDSSFGAYTSTGTVGVTAAGSITNLAAGGTDNSSLVLSVATTTAGTVQGTIQVHQASNGTISGLGNTALADQNPAVSGTVQATVTNLAAPQINNAPVTFGNVRIGSTQSTALSITNTAPAGNFSESLVANTAGGGAGVAGGATLAGGFGTGTNVPSLAPQATDSTHVTVGLNTTSAGVKSGTATINFKSDGTAFAGGMVTDLGTTNVGVSGTVYRLANPTLNTPSLSLAARVGGSANGTVSVTNTSLDAFTEGLTAGLATGPAGFTSSGAVTNLAAGGTDAGSLRVGLNTMTAGTFTGTQAVSFTSTGAGTTGAADMALAGGSVAVTGKVYQAATASVTPNPVVFGTVHIGDVVATRSLTVGNTASGALTDVLTGGFGTVSGPFSGTGTLGAGVAAGTSSTSLQVGLSTMVAGVFGGTAGLNLASHDDDLVDMSVAAGPVSLSGTVNNYAVSGFGQSGGAGVFAGVTNSYTLDFGMVAMGASLMDTLFADNAASGPADALAGMFSVQSGSGFGLTGFSGFSGLLAGMQVNGLRVTFDTSMVGTFQEVIDLMGTGSNDSGYSGRVTDTLLTLRGTVMAGANPVPEPGTLALLASCLAGLLALRRTLRPARSGRR